MTSEPTHQSLASLSHKTGLPGRTIRFYIARNLLPGPRKAGRDAAYGPEHLERLRAIGRLQSRGLTLAEISRQLAEGSSPPAAPEPSAWWHYAVAEDVTVTVRADVSPWRLKQIKNQVAQMAASLRVAQQEEKQ